MSSEGLGSPWGHLARASALWGLTEPRHMTFMVASFDVPPFQMTKAFMANSPRHLIDNWPFPCTQWPWLGSCQSNSHFFDPWWRDNSLNSSWMFWGNCASCRNHCGCGCSWSHSVILGRPSSTHDCFQTACSSYERLHCSQDKSQWPLMTPFI